MTPDPLKRTATTMISYLPDRRSTTPEVAKALGIHVSTLTKMVREGRAPASQTPGGRYRLNIAEVKEALDNDTLDHTLLSTATDEQIWRELSRRWRKRETKHMIRSVAAEARHQLHETSSRLLSAREEIGKGYDKPEHIESEVRAVIAKLEALIEYAKTGRGGTSHLRDRNA